jgi:hypothetical protein
MAGCFIFWNINHFAGHGNARYRFCLGIILDKEASYNFDRLTNL